MTSFIFLNLKKIREKADMEEAVIKISQIIDVYSTKSLNLGKGYKILIDYNLKKIEVKGVSSKQIEEIIILPSEINYKTPYTINGKEQLLNKIELTTTENGNISNSLSIYIFNYSNHIKYRLTTYNFQQNKILKINIYKKIKNKEISEKELIDYHKTLFTEEALLNDWRKEY